MKIEEIAHELRPLSTKLLEAKDEEMAIAAIIAKAMIFMVMSLGDQVEPDKRDELAREIAVRLGPLWFENVPDGLVDITRETLKTALSDLANWISEKYRLGDQPKIGKKTEVSEIYVEIVDRIAHL